MPLTLPIAANFPPNAWKHPRDGMSHLFHLIDQKANYSAMKAGTSLDK
jgi:hypothetical protein